MRTHIQEIAHRLIDGFAANGSVELISEFAEPLPAIVTAELLGVPTSDYPQLKDWSATFAEMRWGIFMTIRTAPRGCCGRWRR